MFKQTEAVFVLNSGRQVCRRYEIKFIQCVSWIWASSICLWWFDIKLEPIFTTGQAASKNELRSKVNRKQPSRVIDLNP
jgi:hypothetical protein